MIRSAAAPLSAPLHLLNMRFQVCLPARLRKRVCHSSGGARRANFCGQVASDLLQTSGRGSLFTSAFSAARAVSPVPLQKFLRFRVWAHGPSQDLSDPALQQALIDSARSGAFAAVGFSPPWATFFAALTPRLRSKDFPLGLPGLGIADAAKVESENRLCEFVLSFQQLLCGLGMPFWIDAPLSSLARSFPGFSAFVV